MSELKGLKIKNAVEGKVMTTDENGVAVSSDKDVQDIASATELSNVESRVTDTEANVDSLDTRVSNNESNIDGLDTRVSDNESNIDSLDQRISTLENNVQDISNSIEDINGEVVG